MEIINSKRIRGKKLEILKESIECFDRSPKLVIIQVEGDTASNSYVKNKIKLGNECGVEVRHTLLSKDISQEKLENVVSLMNNDSSVDGIIVQLPLPCHINEAEVTNKIDCSKDVDGLTMMQMGMLLANDKKALHPCTASGVMSILNQVTDLHGKDVVVVNRSHLIGVPLQAMLTNMNATVTMCHSKTKNLKGKMLNADIVVTGIGKGRYFDKSYFKDGQIIIDCSMNFIEGKLCGDVNLDSIKDLNVKVASGPGHTGPATVLSLMINTVKAYMHKYS